MKKTLFSLAFVAASGIYVAAANHRFFPSPGDGSPAVATETLAPARPASPSLEAPSALPASPTAPAASTTPLLASSQPAAPEVPQIVARAAPTSMPPLPRPRPATPAPAAVQPATSADTAAASTSGYRDGTYTGSDENAYYGRVQVQVAVAGHQIVSVKVLDYPQDRRTSRYINSQALPQLKQEVIAADSANIDTISGATLTSEAYIRSLGNALAQAGGSNA